MPLTLTLSPQAGRGKETAVAPFLNVAAKRSRRWGRVRAANLLLPACREKVAGRPDEGQIGR